MKYRVLSKKIQQVKLHKDMLQIQYKRNKNDKMWCIYNCRYAHFSRSIYEIEHILIQYPESVVKVNSYCMIDCKEKNDHLLISHLDM